MSALEYNDLITRYNQLNTRKKGLTVELKITTDEMRELDSLLIQMMDKSNLQKIASSHGEIVRNTQNVYQFQTAETDPDAKEKFFNFVADEQHWQLLYQRVGQRACKELLEEGIVDHIPGVEVYEKQLINFKPS